MLKKLKIKTALATAGHHGKWIYTLRECAKQASGWKQLVAKTVALKPNQLAKLSFSKTIASKSMWIITAVVSVIEVGVEFKDYYDGKITGAQFFLNSGKILIANAAGIGGGFAGACAGALIGGLFGPIGVIIGGIAGGIIGSITASTLATLTFEKIEEIAKKYNAKKLVEEARDFYELPVGYTAGDL